MSIFKRGRVYWYHFVFNGQHIQQSSKQGNPRVARQMEAAHRTALAKGEVGIVDRKPVPTLKQFSQRFIDAISVRSAAKPNTVKFYAKKLNRLLDFDFLASSPLDGIDEALIESFVQERTKQVSPASVNRELATLRRLLRLAQEWKVIVRVPRIRLLPGERIRELVLSRELEPKYLKSAPQPLRDVATLIVDAGLRVGEAVALRWSDVKLEPIKGAKLGSIQIRAGKSKNAKRTVPLTGRVQKMLSDRLEDWKKNTARGSICPWVFANSDGVPISVDFLDRAHSKLRADLNLPADFVLHSLRHTMLTRLGESGVDAFTIMRIAGHSTIVVSQRYVHPSSEAVERAFERLQALNESIALRSQNDENRRLLATVSATSEAATAGVVQ
jgi:integrase